jgi:CRISPR system Cascade subunit CasE
MYLSRLFLNPRSRQVRNEIADLYEMHRTVMKAFAIHLESDERVLFRLDVHPQTGIPTLLVQSQYEPDWSFLFAPEKNYLHPADDFPLDVENPAVKAVNVDFHPGQVLAFRLRANPTVKKDREGKKQGRRVALVREEDQLMWMERKLETAGASLVSARTSNETKLNGERKYAGERQALSFLSVLFDGVLQVKDPAEFKEALQTGIGSGKGLGFGLLSLAPSSLIEME